MTNNPFEALAEAQDFLLDRVAETPEAFRLKLREIIRAGNLPLPIAMRDAGELIYAWRDKLPADMLTIGEHMIGALIFNRQFGYEAERGPALVSVLQGSGEGDAPEPVRELTESGLAEAERPPIEAPAPGSEAYTPGPL